MRGMAPGCPCTAWCTWVNLASQAFVCLGRILLYMTSASMRLEHGFGIEDTVEYDFAVNSLVVQGFYFVGVVEHGFAMQGFVAHGSNREGIEVRLRYR